MDFVLSPEEAFNTGIFKDVVHKRLGIVPGFQFVVHRRSIDARSRNIKVLIHGEVQSDAEVAQARIPFQYNDVHAKPPVLIVGAGPAGLFCALRLIELGYKPIVLERGKDVRSRRRDLAAINKEHVVNPDSNYCFGEGGAGTYSDGKLYTRSKKRGDIKRILEIFYKHGAREEILFDAHPHIGTNKLPQIVSAISETITKSGGEIHFNTKVLDISTKEGQVTGVITSTGDFFAKAVVLATGHSARDIFRMLASKGVYLEVKPFALGLRVEHQQQLIDKAQYHMADRGQFLPAAAYSLVHQSHVSGKQTGVFSFCMCPGGFIVPSATQDGEVVVNGMSPSRRDSKFANSGIVVSVGEADFAPFKKAGVLAGLEFQSDVERKACVARGQAAPAQLLKDFVGKKTSTQLLECSYQPGLVSTDLHAILPKNIGAILADGFEAFGKKIPGYLTNEAQVVGVESRTSSPVKIPRQPDTLEHVQLSGLYPCGEGAGYAGGIMSAAMDGERIAEAIAQKGLK